MGSSRRRQQRRDQQKRQESAARAGVARQVDDHDPSVRSLEVVQAEPDLEEPSAQHVAVRVEVDRFVRLDEIAERLNVSTRTLRNWRQSGRLPLRRLLGEHGPWGMSETELLGIIRGTAGSS